MSKGNDYANRYAIDLARVEAGSIAQVQSYLADLEKEIVGKLQNSGISAGQSAKLNTILTETRAAISQTYGRIKSVANSDMKGVAELSSHAAGRIVNADLGVDVFGRTLTENQISALLKSHNVFGAHSSAWWNGQEKALQDKFARQMRLGYSLGEDVDALSRRVRGTAANGFKDGVMNVSKREADALVRSSVQTISNAARMAGFEQLPELIKGIQWIATLDTRTTPICKALDRKVWTLPGLKPVGHNKVFPGVTAHWNCRSTQIPYLKPLSEILGKKVKLLDDQTMQEAVEAKLREKGWTEERIAKYRVNSRASMNGQVPASEDYDAWLRKQPDERILKTLGKTRGRMFIDGKINVSDLTDQSNRPLTVDELKRSIELGKRPPETEGRIPRVKPTTTPKAAERTAVEKAAKSKIDTVAKSTDPADRQLKLSLGEVQAAEPALTPAQTLAKAEERTAAAIRTERDAETLAKARAKLADGKALARAEADVVDRLPPAAKADFVETVNAAKSSKTIDDLNAATRLFDDAGKVVGSPGSVRSALEKLPPEFRKTVVETMDGRASAASAESVLTAWRADPIKSKALALVPSGNISSAALIREATIELPAIVAQELAPMAAGKTAANRVLKELTGLDAPAVPTLKRWLADSAVDIVAFLAIFEALKTAREDREKAAATLASAKASLVAGKALTRAEQAALDDMTPAERSLFDEGVEDAKRALG